MSILETEYTAKDIFGADGFLSDKHFITIKGSRRNSI